MSKASIATGARLVVYPVKDLDASTALFSDIFGAAPQVESSQYVLFQTGDIEVGLDPNGPGRGIRAPIVYWPVADIHKTLQLLLQGGAVAHTDVTDTGSGRLVAIVQDAGGNLIGLTEE